MLINVVFAIDPSSEYLKTPKDYNLKFSEVKVKTDDKAELNTWIITENEKSNDILIMTNSDIGNMSDFLPYANFVSKNLKKTVILFDYRGYGKSSDYIHSKFALSDKILVKDLRTVIQYSQKKYPSAKITLYGFSMGASIALLAAKNENVESLFLDSPMISPIDVLKRVSNKNVFLNDEDFFDLTNSGDQLRAKEVFFIQGKNDNVNDANILTKFYSAVNIKKNILILENNKHGDISNLYSDLYLYYLKTCLIN